MEQHLLTLLAGAVCLSVAASSSTRPSDATTAWLEQHEHELGSAAAAAALAKPHFHTCPQDHFDGTNLNTWEQAFYVNDTYWVPGSKAPVFVCVGGEGPPLTGAVVVASPHCNVAVEWLKESKALMLAVEHRYYGCHNMSACPVKDWEAGTKSLEFLSSHQALADIGTFVAHAKAKYKLTADNKFVSFGGSYPGMLAGWTRLKYPNLIHAAVASSAPVQARVNMEGYFDVTAEAYAVSDNNVGGSKACMSNIGAGHAKIGTMMQTGAGRTQLKALFPHIPSAAWLAVRANQAQFAGQGVAQFPAQGNDPTCTFPCCNIGKICKIMSASTDPVALLAKLAKAQMATGLSSMQPRWLRASSSQRALRQVGDMDFWGYQTCTEFGFYQTCDVGSKCFFTQGYDTVNASIANCQKQYGITSEKLYQNVAQSNAFYGGWRPQGSRVLYANGEVDPWHSLSVLPTAQGGEPARAAFPTLWVGGASHHAWTHPSLATDQPSVVAARATIRKTVTAFLADEE